MTARIGSPSRRASANTFEDEHAAAPGATDAVGIGGEGLLILPLAAIVPMLSKPSSRPE